MHTQCIELLVVSGALLCWSLLILALSVCLCGSAGLPVGQWFRLPFPRPPAPCGNTVLCLPFSFVCASSLLCDCQAPLCFALARGRRRVALGHNQTR
jgi:hypothetical protein